MPDNNELVSDHKQTIINEKRRDLVMYNETPLEQVDELMKSAVESGQYLKKRSVNDRATLMYAIAEKIELLGDALIEAAKEETSLPEARLVGEKARTVFQWRSYADAILAGSCLSASIDTAKPEKTPPKPDLRKIMVPVGPVAVFGASNFPFAFSTAGGDTASAIAAGCPVIVKAHPGHPKTSTIMANAIKEAIVEADWPEGIFNHIYGASKESGAYLVSHKAIKSVAFTGSFQGGKALFDLAAKREEPIPVFAEMGSVNPVFVLPNKLAADPQRLANQYIASLTLGVGQFCTNPGVLIAYENEHLAQFKEALATAAQKIAPANMLHEGIAKSYAAKKQAVLAQQGVAIIAKAQQEAEDGQGAVLLAEAKGESLLENEALLDEVFGPFGLIVYCKDKEEVLAVANKLNGQLTITLAADEADLDQHQDLVEILKEKCGRLLFNGWPTGVEVCLSMQHGGPYPASTDSRFTSVGADAIKRFLRPLAYQNWPDSLLPDELKNSNPQRIYRTVNNVLTKDALSADSLTNP